MGRRLPLAVVGAAAALGLVSGCHQDAVTVPSLSASCSASPASGAAPLRVTFTLDVAGAQGVFTVAIDYGDGTTGSDPGAAHLYAGAGSFSPAFTVTTPTQSARCSAVVTVAAPQPTPSPTPVVNRPPEAVFHTNPADSGSTISGKAPLTVEFNLCRTSDPDGDPLRFEMDLDGNGTFEYQGSTGADCRHGATYGAGTHPATMCVTDIPCLTWPACAGYPPIHPRQCRSYSVVVTP
jgi:PKD repeat protein